jgi:predicted phosphate transport protein (TIGR00153 family)
MFKWFNAIMPKENRFFGRFADHAETLAGGAAALAKLVSGELSSDEAGGRITDLEHQADDITRDVLLMVRRTYITPFDRSAITDLISAMDDAIDEMRQAAKVITLYQVTEFEPEQVEMAHLAEQAARLVGEAVPLLRKVGSNGGRLDEITGRIVHLEGRADELRENGLRALFQRHGQSSPMTFFIGREIYIHLEKILDRFEDVANEIQGIVIDHA